MMFNSINKAEDITYFLNEINYLHDSYIIKVEYINDGISKIDHGLYFDPKQTKLVLKIFQPMNFINSFARKGNIINAEHCISSAS